MFFEPQNKDAKLSAAQAKAFESFDCYSAARAAGRGDDYLVALFKMGSTPRSQNHAH